VFTAAPNLVCLGSNPHSPGEDSNELFECPLNAVWNVGRRILEVVADFEDGRRRRWESPEGIESGGPVNGAVAGPEMFIADAVVVVHVKLSDALTKDPDGFSDTGCNVRMPEVEADVDLVEVGHIENRHQVFGRSSVAGQVFDKNSYTQRLGEGSKVLKGRGGIFKQAHGEAIEVFAKMYDKLLDRNVLGDLESALDLVHRIDTTRLFRVDEVDSRRACPTHLAVRPERSMHGPGL